MCIEYTLGVDNNETPFVAELFDVIGVGVSIV